MYIKSQKLRMLRREMEAGTLFTVALAKVGIKSRQALDYWRQKKPRVDRYVKACMERCKERRVSLMEDAQFKNGLKGNARAQELFLCNHAGDRWKNMTALNQVINVQTNVGKEEPVDRFKEAPRVVFTD